MKKTIKILVLFILLNSSFTNAQSTYNLVYNIFQSNCISCHNSTTQAGSLNLDVSANTVYSSIVNANPVNATALAKGDKRVDPGYPHRSFLLRKIQNGLDADNGITAGEGLACPQNSSNLNDKEIELIRQWIFKGAKQTGNQVDTAVINKYYNGYGIHLESSQHPVPTDPGSFQVHIGKIFLDTAQEMEYFIKYDLKLPDTLEVNRIELFLANQSHHFIVYKLMADSAVNFNDGMRIFDPNDPGNPLLSSTGQNTLVNAWQASRNDTLPTGTAYEWETSTVLDFNHHLFNGYGDTILASDVYLNIYTQPKHTATSIMYSGILSNPFIYLVPNQTIPLTWYHVFPNQTRMWNIWLLSSHTHKYGIDFDIFERNSNGSKGTQIFEGWWDYVNNTNQGFYDWEHPPVALFGDTLHPINPQKGFIQEATFLNTGSTPVSGGYTTEDEMMLFFIQFTLGNTITGIESFNEKNNKINLNAFPNPYNNQTQIVYQLNKKEIVTVIIFDGLGKKIQTIVDHEMQNKGNYLFDFNAKSLGCKAGIYLVSVTIGNEVYCLRIVETQ